ncbi:iron complex transport system ATP-binding protein [Plantibacter sp. VKM Ac-1784]|uniref:Iron complex transport system ATP-binding protein n=1 Tax=Plantibacter elymi (nom. nud.) TaxID=199708 RepID=A0ABY1RG41_9MICO|nr:ABC transporter ATP-binding protein [Plantibacter sp. VKM Ac-1784]SMQ71210.1 iron complex transport system ATP-binding protein [Plantibacter sp. VKM Ac-1784]
MSAITVRSLAVTFGRLEVLHDIDVDVPAGKFTALVGRNGSGKSTLLGAFAGGTGKTRGTIRVGTEDLLALRPAERARRIGVLPQDALSGVELTVAEVVELGLPSERSRVLAGRDRRDARAAVDRALLSVGALGLAERSLSALSGGERQRVLLARAVVGDPDVLVLDEPTNHLDPGHQFDVLSLASSSGATVIAALHTLDLAIQFADHLVVLDAGTIVSAGPPTEALTEEVLTSIFGVRGAYLPAARGRRPHLTLDQLDPGRAVMISDR